MFQYAAVLGISNKTGHIPVANIKDSDLGCFELGGAKDGIEMQSLIYNEPEFSFDEKVFTYVTHTNFHFYSRLRKDCSI